MESGDVTALIHRAAEGDQDAWNAIVDEYAGLVWSVVRGYRLGDAQAADAVQTTWLRLVEHLSAIREPERVAGWLRTTARRVCLEAIRNSGREHLVADHREDACATSGHRGEGERDGPETCTLRREQQALVRAALATLSERHQVLLGLLVASPPVSYEEISTRLDMPIGSIGPTRARVVARLRNVLETAGLHDLALA
jgi:RNA polymerase sigma factor (sigma-70 family)